MADTHQGQAAAGLLVSTLEESPHLQAGLAGETSGEIFSAEGGLHFYLGVQSRGQRQYAVMLRQVIKHTTASLPHSLTVNFHSRNFPKYSFSVLRYTFLQLEYLPTDTGMGEFNLMFGRLRKSVLNRNILELADYHLYLGIEILTHWRLLNHPQYYSGDKKCLHVII